MIELNKIYNEDCLEGMKRIPDGSVDMIFADPPYELAELPTLPDLIFEHQMLSEGGLFVLEHGKKNDFSTHPHFVEQRIYGSVHFSFFQ